MSKFTLKTSASLISWFMIMSIIIPVILKSDPSTVMFFGFVTVIGIMINSLPILAQLCLKENTPVHNQQKQTS